MLLFSCVVFVILFDLQYAWLFLTTTQAPAHVAPLGRYNVDVSNISVSGISAGGAFATQFHVAHSNKIMGMASLAGVPYHCALGALATALSSCMKTPSSINAEGLLSYARLRAADGDVDPISAMARAKIFIFSGTRDRTVIQGVSRKMEAFYNLVVPVANIKTDYHKAAGHIFPTENYGVSCGLTTTPYIGKCGYNAAYDLLNHIYRGQLIRPTASGTTLPGQFLLFDQTEFPSRTTGRKKRQSLMERWMNTMRQMMGMHTNPSTSATTLPNPFANMQTLGQSWWNTVSDYWRRVMAGSSTGTPIMNMTHVRPGSGLGFSFGGSASGLDTAGFAYIPSQCVDGQRACKLHVVFHGCLMGRYSIGDKFARHTGYNEVAELNNIIILYPQVINQMGKNPNGCWDWWGYTNSANYDIKTGIQMLAVDGMIQRVTG